MFPHLHPPPQFPPDCTRTDQA